MAFSGMGSGGGYGRSRFRTNSALSEMNVVPLVDVVLVLLIIFMVTASVMEFGLEVQVPKVKSTSSAVADVQVVVSVDKNSTTFLDNKATNINVLAKAIRQKYPDAKDVYVKADQSVDWGVVARVVAAVGDTKLNVRLVTRPEDVRVGR